MEDEGNVPVVHHDEGNNAGKWILLALAVIYVAGSLYFLYSLRSKVETLGKEQAASNTQISELTKRMQAAEADDETLAQQVGLTKKELANRSSELLRQQRAAEARLAEQQKKQITAVSGEVAGVKTEVGGVKTDVATTRSELEATRAKLESTIGDLGVQSGLIAHTRDDLETLKHRGDRNDYEFTLLQRRQAAARVHRESAASKDRPEKGEIHDERYFRRQDDRKEGQKLKRADPVLQRPRPYAVRVGRVDHRQKQGWRLSEHSKNAPVPVSVQQ